MLLPEAAGKSGVQELKNTRDLTSRPYTLISKNFRYLLLTEAAGKSGGEANFLKPLMSPAYQVLRADGVRETPVRVRGGGGLGRVAAASLEAAAAADCCSCNSGGLLQLQLQLQL